MSFKRLGVAFAVVAAVGGTGKYLANVLTNPEHRGAVGDIAIKALDAITPNADWNQLETPKARVVAESLSGKGKFNFYLDGLLRENAPPFYDARSYSDVFKLSQELKKLSDAEMRKSGFDEDELRGFFLYLQNSTHKRHLEIGTVKPTLKELSDRTISAIEEQYADIFVSSKDISEFVKKFTSGKNTGQGQIALALLYPKTEFQKDTPNQRIAKEYLVQKHGYKKNDLTPQKLLEIATKFSPLDTLERTDNAAYLLATFDLNCVAAFATAQINGIGHLLRTDPMKAGQYYFDRFNKRVGGNGGQVIEARIKEYNDKLLSAGGAESISLDLDVCQISYRPR